MNDKIQIGLIADFDAQKPSHIATLDGLKHTAAILLSILIYSKCAATKELRKNLLAPKGELFGLK